MEIATRTPRGGAGSIEDGGRNCSCGPELLWPRSCFRPWDTYALASPPIGGIPAADDDRKQAYNL
jgi:hypothetical protein